MLLLIVLLIQLVHQLEHTCIHDKMQQQVQVRSIDLTQSKRQLTSLRFQNGFKIYFNYDPSFNNLNQDDQKVVKTNMIAYADQYFNKVILQTYTARNYNLDSFSGNQGGRFKIPYNLPRNFDLYVNVGTELIQGSTLAYALGVLTSNSRTVYGEIVLNTNQNYKNNPVSKNLIVIIHELLHLVGVSSSIFQRLNHLKYAYRRGKQVQQIETPKLVDFAKKYFNCQSLTGVELEDQGSTGSAGSHWEMRIAMQDMMVFTVIYDGGFSGFTGYYLEDTGFYKINPGMLHDIQYGKNGGCSFVDQQCIKSNTGAINDLFKCTPSEKICTPTGIGYGYCGSSSSSTDYAMKSYYNYYGNYKQVSKYYDYCPTPSLNFPCNNPNTQSSTTAIHFKYGLQSRCAKSTLAASGYTVNTYTACYQMGCIGDRLVMTIGSQTVDCTRYNQVHSFNRVSINGVRYTGNVYCPDPKQYCGTYRNMQYFESYSVFPYQDKAKDYVIPVSGLLVYCQKMLLYLAVILSTVIY